ncbi:MAG TPA: PAS domain S-box protein, partial [Methanomicrobiales archaeon]|nr:PAS domain S-box protein [Methanomicrobiales archaeon]
ILLSGGLALVLSRRLTRPIESMVQDADAIAHGDLDRSIAPAAGSEVAILGRSINTMVEKLKESIREVQMSEERYRAVVESQNELICRFRPDGRIIFTNEAFCRYLGLPCETLVGMSITSIVLEGERELLKAHLESLTPDNPSGTIEHRVVMPGNATRWLQWNTRAAYNPEGVVIEYQSVGRDITERQKIEEELRESEKKYKDLVSLLPLGVFEVNMEGMVTFANQYALDAFGHSEEDIRKGVSGNNMIIPEQREKVARDFQLALQGVQSGGKEYVALRSDGSTMNIMIHATPIFQNNRVVGLRGAVVDITHLKKAEGAIRHLNEQLEHRVAQRTADLETAVRELESYSYSVSHDLRAPLRAIDGYSGILLSEYESTLPPEARIYLEKVRSNTQQMSILIDALLNLSRISRSSLNRQTVQVSDVVKEVWENLRSEREGRVVEFTMGVLPPARVDRSLITQVYHNILSNALKFTRGCPVAQIEAGSFKEGERIVYYVKDNGVGFDPGYAQKLVGV